MPASAPFRAGRATLLAAALAFALAGPSSSAFAHELAKGPNGGPLIDSAGHHLELVARERELVLFLSDAADKPVPSAGVKGARAIVQDAGKTATVALTPAEPNRLVGSLSGALGAGARVVVSVTLPDGAAVQGRFVLP